MDEYIQNAVKKVTGKIDDDGNYFYYASSFRKLYINNI